MPILAWDDAFSVGVPAFDAHHRDLLVIINALYDQAQAGATAASLASLCDELIDHTVRHFDNEEARFEGYPRASEHRRMHDKLKERVVAFRQELTSGNAVDGTKLITDWLAHHITGEDKNFGVWLNQPH